MSARRHLPLVICAALAVPILVHAATKTQTFQVSVTIVGECTVITPANLNFGTNVSAGFSAAIDAQTSIDVTCAANTPYVVSLNGGTNGSLADRRMASGGNQLSYQIYTANSRLTIWGDGSGGTQTVPGTGNGAAQTLTVYGRLPVPGTSPAPGVYTDTVTATLTY